MASKSEAHNALAHRFIYEVVGPVITSGATYAEIMVVFETAQVGMLEILNLHHGLTPQVSTGLVEASLEHAIERFAGNRSAA